MSEDLSSTPVRVARNGGWVPTDLSLVQQSDGSYAPAAAPVSVTVGGAGSRQVATFTSAGGGSVSYGWNAPLPAPQVSGSTATFPDVAPGVDLVAQVTYTGVETSVVFKTPTAAAAGPVDLPLTTSGLTAQMGSNRAVSYVDASGATVAQTPVPQSWDSRLGGTVTDPGGGPVDAVSSTITTAAGAVLAAPGATGAASPSTTSASGSLTDQLQVPTALLDDPATTYPIVLDPGLGCSGCTEGHHGYVENDGYNEIDSGWDSGHVHVGTFDGGTTVARGLFQFAMGNTHGTTITSADLELTEVDSWNATAEPVTVYQSGGFDTSATWPGPAITTANASTASYAFGHEVTGGVNMNVQAMVQAMASTPSQTSYTFQFRVGTAGNWGGAEADSSYWKEFAGQETLHVDFDRPPGDPSGKTVSGCWVQCSGPAITHLSQPYLHGLTTDPDGDHLTYYYKVYTGFISSTSGQSPYRSGADPEASGTMSQWQVSPALPDGNYTYVVQAYDGLLYGPQSAVVQFTVDTVRPATPTVTSSVFDMSNATQKGSENVPGAVTLHPNGSTGNYEYVYSFAGGVPVDPPACNTTVGAVSTVCSDQFAADGSATVTIDPGAMLNTLYVEAFDKAGNVSTSGGTSFTVQMTPDGQPDHAWIDYSSAQQANSRTISDWSPPSPNPLGTSWSAKPMSLSANVTWADPNVSGPFPHYQALTFPGTVGSDGKAGAVTSGTPLTVDATHSVTMAAWIDPAAVDSSRHVAVAMDGPYNSQFWLLQNENGGWQFCMPTSQTIWAWDCASTPNNVATANTWTFLVGVWDAAKQQLRLYVNGDTTTIYTGSHTTVPAASPGGVTMGRGYGQGQSNFYLWNGSVADPLVYNEVLDNSQIHNLSFGLPTSLQGS